MQAEAQPAAIIAPLPNEDAERRAQKLEQEIRCVVCENEPISQSTADIALDMRRLVRQKIEAGETDDEIRAFFAERYGDFVLLRPPMDARTWALWLAPLLLAGVGALIVARARGAKPDETLEPIDSER